VIRPRNEHTIAAPCEVRGRGYWGGREVHVSFSPAPPGSGIRFVRSDLPGRPGCDVSAAAVIPGALRTGLCQGAASFAMIEHVMAALYGLQVDNCVVEVDGEELPGLDGSSGPFVDALRSVGMVLQGAARQRLIIDRTIRVEENGGFIEASPTPDGHPVFEYHLDYGDASPIKRQCYRGALSPHTFAREVALARTFVTAEQVVALRAQGVGGHVTHRDLLVFDRDGLVDNELRFLNECARHKTLDLIGDLAVTGFDLIGHFESHRGGHRLNGLMASRLMELAGCGSKKTSIGLGRYGGIPGDDDSNDRGSGETELAVAKVPWGHVACSING
jgi:UDP-3-O-acyl N-acetylglucosamine deacetylase